MSGARRQLVRRLQRELAKSKKPLADEIMANVELALERLGILQNDVNGMKAQYNKLAEAIVQAPGSQVVLTTEHGIILPKGAAAMPKKLVEPGKGP